MRHAIAAEGGRLLRVLFVRRCALSTARDRTDRLLLAS